ncbi:hypothetical protein HHK36_026007 [Tetracentron sinense]|uniref:BED-type domain-containing protein n=1 Tax=Tetracentron sinense TaxID=13715 RepID=A0A835D6Y5_TETSI|nr:hypothetical protein HHK36_026007 [Tetracentron sinense]
MRRRPGIGGLQNAAAARDQYRLLGENVAKIRTDLMKEQLSTFRSQLEDFARKHKNDIRKNPAFRSQFHEMCAKVGVDPLASNKGFWAELLGIGDFYYELEGKPECVSKVVSLRMGGFEQKIDALLKEIDFSMCKVYTLLFPMGAKTGIYEFKYKIAAHVGFMVIYPISHDLNKFVKPPLSSYVHAGVQIVDICLATRPLNGGLINLQELRGLVCQRRKIAREAVSEDDCLRAISKLKVLYCFTNPQLVFDVIFLLECNDICGAWIFQVLGNGFEVISVGKKKLVRSVPTELNKDHNEILELAQMPRDSEPDVGWKHGRCIDGNKQKAVCNYCGHRILSGGVARLKQHLVGGFSNVKDCPNCPKEVKMAMKKLLLGRIIEKKEKEKREAEFNESLMDPPYRDDMVHVGDSDDDGVQYPSDCETEQQRIQHRLAVRASVADQWDADQRGRHRIGGSSGVGTSRAGGFGAGGSKSGAGTSRFSGLGAGGGSSGAGSSRAGGATARGRGTALKEVKWYRDSIGSFNRNAAVAGRQNTPPEQNREDYSDPIDLSDIFCEEGEEDPLFEWVKDVGEPLLDEAGGRPSSQIAQQMGVDVDEYMTTQSQGRDIDWSSSSSEAAPPSLSGGGDGDGDDDGGNESAQLGGGASGGGVGSVGGGSENIEMSLFTVEQNFDHTTQDEDHASRPAPRDQTYRRRRYKLMEVDESGHPIQNTDVGPMTATMDSLSIGSGRRDTSSSASYGFREEQIGFATVEEVERRLSWSSGRATDALETLLEEGLAMIDDGHRDGKRRYWFPCVSSISASVVTETPQV